ncbi:MAG: helix-turn-helix domain-containing protein [Huintestinicola sp.]
MEELTYITVRQPFFAAVSDTYKKLDMMNYGIVHFFEFVTSREAITAVPDGAVDMVFCCCDEPYAYVNGTVLTASEVKFEPGKLYFGVRFLPGYNPILGENAMGSLINNRIAFEELVDDEKMLRNIYSADSFRDRIQYFFRSYMSIYSRIHPMDKSNLIVRHSINVIFRSKGNVTVERLAEETGYSTRYINQCFRSEISMSPKQFIKMIRFQSALDMMHSSARIPMIEVAEALGYFDQAHFIREFKECTGMTPKKYRMYLDSIGYEDKIEKYK